MTGDARRCWRLSSSARMSGDFAGQPATGLQVRWPYSMAYDVVDGSITAIRAYFPMTALSCAACCGRPVESGAPA